MPRILRSIVCLLLILCLIISWSPIRAEAVAVEASIAIGLIAMMILASAGVVYTANTTGQIQAIGNSFQTHMFQWGTSAEKLDEVDAFFNGLHLYDPGSGDDDETPHEKQVRLARGILAGITAWVASTIMAGKIDVEQKKESVVLYNEPFYINWSTGTHTISSNQAIAVYCMIGSYGGNTFCCPTVISDTDGTYKLNGSSRNLDLWPNNLYGHYYATYAYDFVSGVPIVNLGEFESQADFYTAIQLFPYTSTSIEYITIEPSIYVGDIPEQLQNGELEPEDIPLPDINLEPYLEDGQLAPQKVIDAMTNLSTGALPYDQFLQQSTLPPEIDDGGTDSDSGTSSDTWQPPSNPGQFALDLTKYFPFCIPFDLYDLFTCLNADPVAPVIHWELPMPGGSTYPIELDLSPFNSVAQLLRRMQLLLFCVGLAIKTRDLIKG